RADLCAELADGRVLHGEASIDQRVAPLPRIERVFLDRQVTANPRALRAVREADAIVIGPGDLYTSILPVFLVDGMAEAFAASAATRIMVCNLMTKRGETDGFRASDFVREFERYAGDARLDWAIVNTAIPEAAVQAAYDHEGA
ncbi:2-phospho-L-lactate transferase CofD family protein, partial [Arthrospira platensis SPKY2]